MEEKATKALTISICGIDIIVAIEQYSYVVFFSLENSTNDIINVIQLSTQVSEILVTKKNSKTLMQELLKLVPSYSESRLI
jgi:hypothetical protein